MKKVINGSKNKVQWFLWCLLLVLCLNAIWIFVFGGKEFIKSMNQRFDLDLFAMYYGYFSIFVTFAWVTHLALKKMNAMSEDESITEISD